MFKEVDLTDAKLEKELGMGCLHIKGTHLWPLDHFVWSESATEVSATFFCQEQDEWDKISLLRIEVFKLPRAKKKLAERREWYTRDRKKRRIKISDGDLFDESMLAVKGLRDWEQDAFPLSKGEIIRIYQSKKYAVIFRFLAKSGSMLQHPVFKRVVKNIVFDETEWVRDVPEIHDTRPKAKRVKESPLTAKQEAEMWQIVRAVMKSLKLAKVKDPKSRVAAIEKEIKAARANKSLSNDELMDQAIQLGTFLGQLFCWELDWEWCRVRQPKASEFICVASPDRSTVMTPVDWVLDLITDKKRPLNCLLTYNMIEHGRMPPSRPHAYTRIG